MKRTAILIHGWNPNLYNQNCNENEKEDFGWHNRKEFTKLLSKNFDLHYFNLPGFCNAPEPDQKSYDVENFADDFAKWKNQNQLRPDLYIGYSFGGAVLLNYKARYKDATLAILISPAIYRNISSKSEIASQMKRFVPKIIFNSIKHIYQYLTSNYYRQGTSFLRKSYDKIVRRDLRPMLSKVNPSEIFLIYGKGDKETPWDLVKEDVRKRKIAHYLVDKGSHNIGETHAKEVIGVVEKFYLKN